MSLRDDRTVPDAGDMTATHALDDGGVLNWEAAKGTTSWERADTDAALLERASTFGYRVTLPDGETKHTVAIAAEGDREIGRCDCKGWEFNDHPCAHHCVVKKAAFVDETDVRGHRVTIPTVTSEGEERAAPDGGHLVEKANTVDPLAGERDVPGEARR